MRLGISKWYMKKWSSPRNWNKGPKKPHGMEPTSQKLTDGTKLQSQAVSAITDHIGKAATASWVKNAHFNQMLHPRRGKAQFLKG